jgi:hypothetical protein
VGRFTISGRTTIAGTSALPNVSLYATAAVRPRIVEIGLWNTTSTAVTVSVNRLTTAGTQGAGLTEDCDDHPEHVAIATGFAGHTAGPTVGAEKKRATLGAAVGSGVIWTWSDEKALEIPDGTGNGIGVIVPTGTGQVLDYSISWIE